MKILYLDLGLSTGVAYDGADDMPMTELLVLPRPEGDFKDGFEYGPTFARAWFALQNLLDRVKPGLLVYEEITSQRNPHSAKIMEGLSTLVETTCAILHVPIEMANNQTVKKHFTGTGRADKAMMIEACRLWGYDIGDPPQDDRADAAAGWHFTKSCHDPLFARRHLPLMAPGGKHAPKEG